MVWFGSTRASKIALICFGAATLFCIILVALFWVRDAQIQRNFYYVTGRVTDNFISTDRRDSWSVVQFELDGHTHVVRLDYFWIMGHQRGFLVNSDNPEHVIVATGLGTSRLLAMLSSGVLGFSTLFCLINFLANHKRDRRVGLHGGD